MEQDNSCCRFSSVDDIYFRFCWIDISYLTIFVSELIFITFLHFIDIIYDIFITIELYYNIWSIELFYVSLGILILSFTSTSIPINNKTYISSFKNFLLGLFQIKFLEYIYDSFKNKKISNQLMKLRLDKALIENAFQSLFKLYLILTYYFHDKEMNLDFIQVYLSISFSLVSIAYTLISYEIETFNNFYSEENIQRYSYGTKVLSILSPYGICLIFYRLTEIFSRIGLLAYFIEIESINEYLGKNNLYGYHIYFAIIIDFFMANFFEIINYIGKNYLYFYEEEEKNILKDFLILISKIFYKIKYLLVYCEPFTLEYVKEDCQIVEEIELLEKDYFCIPFKYMHFISKFINNSVIIGFLIEELINGEKVRKVTIASIIYISVFFINYIFLYFIWLWNTDREKHNDKFKSIY